MVAMCGVAACGDAPSEAPDIRVTTSFTITEFSGIGPSPLDVLNGQPIGLEVTWDEPLIFHESSPGCRQTVFYAEAPPRVATGPAAATVEAEVLAHLPDWYVVLDLCDVAEQSRIVVDSVIDPLNLQLGCLAVPPSGIVRDDAGNPILTTLTGARCSATILDVVNNRALGASDFTIDFVVGRGRLP